MQAKQYLVLLFILVKFHDYKGCADSKGAKVPSPPSYSLGEPSRVNLPKELNDISGVSYYPKDTSIFAVVDNQGELYKIHLHNKISIQKWHFDKKHDFEDIIQNGNSFYLLLSNGNIEKLSFNGKSFDKTTSIYPDTTGNSNQFEGMYFDNNLKKLIVICKKCQGETTSEVPAWEYSTDSADFQKSNFKIDISTLNKKLGDVEFKFKPSAIALNPITNELYLLSSVNKLLVVADRNGKGKDVFRLDPKTYRDPEGITFTPAGDMIISNEAHGNDPANILVIKRKTQN